jgi:ATP-dependent Clp protease ATP-binding subunit ClpA
MITLARLVELGRAEFPGEPIDLPRQLLAWARKDPDGELAGLLTETGLVKERMIFALLPLTRTSNPSDVELLTRVVVGTTDAPISGRHILGGLCEATDHRITRALVEVGLDIARLRARLEARRPEPAPPILVGVSSTAGRPRLEDLGRDLTSEAKDGAFDSLIDRPEDTGRLVEILCRRTKRNPVLTGDAGSGKTSIAELLARGVARGEMPELDGCRVIEISVGRLVQGTRYRGEFEERMVGLLDTLETQPNVIVFMDEIHLLPGAGRAEGVITDGANLVKPYLSRGKLRVIGATTSAEYHRHFVSDPALARRFEEVRLAPPDAALCLAMLRAHHPDVDEVLLRRAVELTDRHQPTKTQPDKATTLIETARAASRRRRVPLDGDLLLQILAESTGRPLAQLRNGERQSVGGLAARLRRSVVGQDEALDCVAEILRCSLQSLASEERPLGTFLFAGPSGVGKSETARALARELFGTIDALLVVDMAEYANETGVAKLLGAPPGYQGSESRDGVLAGWLLAHGRGVILLDEAEKAAPEVMRSLLGLLEGGRVTSARGERLDARGCVVILTTNAGVEEFGRRPVGFGARSGSREPRAVLAKTFSRELVDRLDAVVVYRPLEARDLDAILELALTRLSDRLARERNLRLEYDAAAMVEALAGEVRTSGGARSVERVVRARILGPLSLSLLDHSPGIALVATLDPAAIATGRVEIRPVEPAPKASAEDRQAQRSKSGGKPPRPHSRNAG